MFGRTSSKKSTVVGHLADRLRHDISLGNLPPNTRLKIEELRGIYGGSAHSLREALTILSTEGMVEASEQRGFRVASASMEDLLDITRLRTEIECLGLSWSMQKSSVDWEGRVLAAHHALSRVEAIIAKDPPTHALDWEECNRAFHMALTEACGSPRLIDIQSSLYQQSRRFRMMALAENALDFDKSRKTHQQILDAVMAGNREKALKILRQHIAKNVDTKEAEAVKPETA